MNLCLFGAGNTGRIFLSEINKMQQYQEEYDEIYFCDNDDKLVGDRISSYEIRGSVGKNAVVLITSMYFQEIYSQCIMEGHLVIGIYDRESSSVLSYRAMCRKAKSSYANEKWFHYAWEKKTAVENSVGRFRNGEKLFDCVTEVAIMLSNLCNYAAFHRACPAGHITEKEILPSKIVYKIIDELAEIAFDGRLCFHIYNEPLIDPRLFLFIRHAKEKMPDVQIIVYSNGYYLNQVMVEDLEDIGADILTLTAYGEEEWDRLLHLDTEMACYILYGNLDHRLDGYAVQRDSAVSEVECKTYLSQVPIYSNGDIGLCCYDYRHSYAIGNVYEKSLKEILNSYEVRELQNHLLEGNRNDYPLCRNCMRIR